MKAFVRSVLILGLTGIPLLGAPVHNMTSSGLDPLEKELMPTQERRPAPEVTGGTLREYIVSLRRRASHYDKINKQEAGAGALRFIADILEAYTGKSQLRLDPLEGAEILAAAMTVVRALQGSEELNADDEKLFKVLNDSRDLQFLRDHFEWEIRNPNKDFIATEERKRVKVSGRNKAFVKELGRSATIQRLRDFPRGEPTLEQLLEFWKKGDGAAPNMSPCAQQELRLLAAYGAFTDVGRSGLRKFSDAWGHQETIRVFDLREPVREAVSVLERVRVLIEPQDLERALRDPRRGKLSSLVNASLTACMKIFPNLEKEQVNFWRGLTGAASNPPAKQSRAALITALYLAEAGFSEQSQAKVLENLVNAAMDPRQQLEFYRDRMTDWIENAAANGKTPARLEYYLETSRENRNAGAVRALEWLTREIIRILTQRISRDPPDDAQEAVAFFHPDSIYMHPHYRGLLASGLEPEAVRRWIDLAMDRLSPLVDAVPAAAGRKQQIDILSELLLQARIVGPPARLLLYELTDEDQGLDLLASDPKYAAVAGGLKLRASPDWKLQQLEELARVLPGLNSRDRSGQAWRLRQALTVKATKQLPRLAADPALDPQRGRQMIEIADSLDLRLSLAPQFIRIWRPREVGLRLENSTGKSPFASLRQASAWAELIESAGGTVERQPSRGYFAQAYYESIHGGNRDLSVPGISDTRNGGKTWERISKVYPEAATFSRFGGALKEQAATDASVAATYRRMADTWKSVGASTLWPKDDLSFTERTVAGSPSAEARFLRLVAAYRSMPTGEISEDWLNVESEQPESPVRPEVGQAARLIGGRHYFKKGEAFWQQAEDRLREAGLGHREKERSELFLAGDDLRAAREEYLVLLGRHDPLDAEDAEWIRAEYESRDSNPAAFSDQARVLRAAARAYAKMQRWAEAESAWHRLRLLAPDSFGHWTDLYAVWLEQNGARPAAELAKAIRDWWLQKIARNQPPPWSELVQGVAVWQNLETRADLAGVGTWRNRDARTEDPVEIRESASVANVALRLASIRGAGSISGFRGADPREVYVAIATNWAGNNPQIYADAGDRKWLNDWIGQLAGMDNLEYTDAMQRALDAAAEGADRAGDWRGQVRLRLLVPSRATNPDRAAEQWVKILRDPRLLGTVEFGAALELILRQRSSG